MSRHPHAQEGDAMHCIAYTCSPARTVPPGDTRSIFGSSAESTALCPSRCIVIEACAYSHSTAVLRLLNNEDVAGNPGGGTPPTGQGSFAARGHAFGQIAAAG